MPDFTADAPEGQSLRGRAEREDRWILHREDGLEPDQEELLHVPQVAHDFLRGPAPRVGSARQGPVVLAVQQAGHLVGRAPQPGDPIADGPVYSGIYTLTIRDGAVILAEEVTPADRDLVSAALKRWQVPAPAAGFRKLVAGRRLWNFQQSERNLWKSVL